MAEGAFQDQLLFYLQDEFLQKKNEGGWNEISDPEVRAYCDVLSRAIRSDAPMPLQDIIERYQHLFGQRGPVHLEQQILEAFPDREMQRLQLAPLRIHRGLPRQYLRTQIGFSKIKPKFSQLTSLKKTAAARFIYSLYQFQPVPSDAKVVILTWVMPDGLGDYFASIESARLIQTAFPYLDIRLFIIGEQKLPVIDGLTIDRYCGSPEQLRQLRKCDLILQMPTYYPRTESLMRDVESIIDPSPQPKWECLGQYGFVDSDWFHPQSTSHCMGLHFLEKGILLRTSPPPSILDLEHTGLSEWLFEQLKPSSQTIDLYRNGNRFFLAYLYSQPGMTVYLHALCKSLEHDAKNIDVCLPDAARLLAYIQQRHQENNGPVEKGYGIQRVVLQIGTHMAVWNLAPKGKTLRLLCPEQLTSEDFQRLLAFSENFVACRGDQSFSEAVSQNKCYFYDPRDHSRYFVKDLIALGANRIPQHRSTIEILRLFGKLLEHQLPPDENDWIDEIGIQRQETMDLFEIGESMGRLLQESDTFIGFRKLNRILREEYCCNGLIVQMVQRAVCHRRHIESEKFEKECLARFIHGQTSISQIVSSLQSHLLGLK